MLFLKNILQINKIFLNIHFLDTNILSFQEELLKKEIDFFSRQILSAAGLNKKEQKKILKGNKDIIEKKVLNILIKNHNNLLEKKEILELIINYKTEILDGNSTIKNKIIDKIKNNFKKNQNLAFLIIKKFIQEEKNISEIKNFIENIAQNNDDIKKILQLKFQELLENYGKINKKQTQKYFFNIKNKALIKQILDSKIINEKGLINNKIFTKLQKELNKQENINTKEELIFFILEQLDISNINLENVDFYNFISKIASLFKIENQKEENSKNIEKNKEQNQEKTNNTKEEEQQAKNQEKEENLEQDNQLVSFCYPGCYLSENGNNYEINLEEQKIEISKEDFNKFNEKSLENYLNFIKILRLTKLDFLLENKYKTGFFIFIGNKFGFDYKSQEGFNETIILKILTTIGNLIGIPKSYYKDEGELGEFDGIISAINIFGEINSTGIINNKKIAEPGSFIGANIIEKQMKRLNILGKEGGFNIEKANSKLEKKLGK